jgi:hypothetical protein
MDRPRHSVGHHRHLLEQPSLAGALHQGRVVAARPLLEESLALARQLGPVFVAAVLRHLGDTLLAQGAHARAQALQAESLVLARRLGLRVEIAGALEGLARLAGARDADAPGAARAARLGGAAAALREAAGAPLSPVERGWCEHQLAAARARLGAAAWAAAWATGRALPLDDALADAFPAGAPT